MYFAVCPWGFSSQIKLFCFAVIYAKQKGEQLKIYQKNNCISPRFAIFEVLYSIPSSNDNATTCLIEYVQHPLTTEQDIFQIKTSAPAQEHLKAIYTSVQELREDVRATLVYNPGVLKHIGLLIEPFIDIVYDIGIHIRSGDKIAFGEMHYIPLSHYYDTIEAELRKYESNRLRPPNIFLMTDNNDICAEFLKVSCERGWNTYTLPSTEIRTEHVQSEFNDQVPSKKIQELYDFLADIEIMKLCPKIICTLSSNVGILTSLLHKSPEIISLDYPDTLATYLR